MEQKIETVDAYIAQYPPEVRERLEALRAVILEAAPEATQKISWGMATFQLNKKNLVHFAVQKHHIGFYPGASGVATFADRLADFKTSKGAIQLPFSKPLPLALVKEIVAFRADENRAL